MSDRVSMIRQRLQDSFNPAELEIEDQSHLHIGHAGAAAGGGHFAIVIVSTVFNDKSRIERHRMVYKALGNAMQSDIHALSMKVFTPAEFASQSANNGN